MENETLATYLATQIRSGMKKAEIKEQLLAVGWSEDEIDAAYARALIAEGVPIPQGIGQGAFSRKSSTVDIMIGFFSFILLGITVSSVGSLFFEIIDRYFPDPLAPVAFGGAASSEAIHYSIAALCIGFPLYFLAVRLWFRRFREDDGRIESRLTKWVTYLVLLAASITIVGDLIAVLFTFLQGEMSVRFFLKALVIFGIAGMTFGFYFLERKKIQYRKDISRTVFQTFGWGLFAVIVCGIILGFSVSGSPSTQRQRTFDERRASDLSELAMCIDQYAQKFFQAPKTLSDLKKSTEFNFCSESVDPETGMPYEYHVLKNFDSPDIGSEAKFELCASFSLSSEHTESSLPAVKNQSGKWDVHGSGRNCDTETLVLKRN